MEHFWLIWTVSLLCAFCIIPVQSRTIRRQVQLQAEVHPTGRVPPVPVLVAVMMLQTSVLLALATAAGLWLLPATGLRLWVVEHSSQGVALPFSLQAFWVVSVVSGFVAGIVVNFVDRCWFQPHMTAKRGQAAISSRFLGLLSSFYGGVCEEVLMRLGVMTVVVFFAQKLGLGGSSYWLGIAVAAIVFACAHLPGNYMTYGKGSIVTCWTPVIPLFYSGEGDSVVAHRKKASVFID
ncbi:type II CAAX prenyl endopeptidase Rce1 family protein [Brevibacillus agri]|uniref:CPBP family glutamic-type intramembrane protease n=1 Tax=Brevibacillus agri TaxID=51101 RepID=UPI002E23E042|nr:CPBP family glutamic-type intramembrane protease [Brevibacillus agri]MED1825265.1 CPBP family intramembrane metalloprotease [Brevibacillus agri]